MSSSLTPASEASIACFSGEKTQVEEVKGISSSSVLPLDDGLWNWFLNPHLKQTGRRGKEQQNRSSGLKSLSENQEVIFD